MASLVAVTFPIGHYAFAKEAEHTYEVKSLDDLVEINEVEISPDFGAATNEIYYYKDFLEDPVDRFRNEGRIDKEYFMTNLLIMDRGYKTQLIPDYTFVRISGGGNILGLCAVYEPKLREVEAQEHKLFPRLESDLILYGGDRIIWDIADLFWRYPETITTDRIVYIAHTAIYIYYWCLVGEGYKYEFGERFQGIYVFDNPLGIVVEPAYKAVDVRERLPEENKTTMVLSLLPKGSLQKVSDSTFDYNFYTWDNISRELLLWYFTSYGGIDFSIKYIVIGKL
jgi:hypothetical protein